MTTVVTGASGHVGGNLVRALLADGQPVRAIVHRDRQALEGLGIATAKGSLEDPASLRKAFRGADTVFHLASKISILGDPDGSVHRTNVQGARNVAEAALEAGVERLVHFSSVHAFDLARADDGMTESHAKSTARNYAYDHSKALGEEQIRAVIAKGLDATIVNPTGVVGPYDFKPSRMGEVFLDLAHRRLPAVVSGAFDFVDVRDVVASAIAARDKGQTGENYLLGGHLMSVREVATLASQATGVPAPGRQVPLWLAAAGVPFAAWGAKRAGTEPKFTRESLGALAHCPEIDCTKARRDLGHRPRDPAESVRDVYAWFAAAGQMP